MGGAAQNMSAADILVMKFSGLEVICREIQQAESRGKSTKNCRMVG